MKKNLIFLIFAICLIFPLKTFAVTEQPVKTIYFSGKTPRILSFNEKILKYKLSDEKSFKSEILSDLFNSRQELLIKPVVSNNGTLTVWTKSSIYSFSMEMNSANSPALSQSTEEIDDFELDSPPKINNLKLRE